MWNVSRWIKRLSAPTSAIGCTAWSTVLIRVGLMPVHDLDSECQTDLLNMVGHDGQPFYADSPLRGRLEVVWGRRFTVAVQCRVEDPRRTARPCLARCSRTPGGRASRGAAELGLILELSVPLGAPGAGVGAIRVRWPENPLVVSPLTEYERSGGSFLPAAGGVAAH
jgi:hypothetical protein